MGLFKRRTAGNSAGNEPTPPVGFGSGRRLHSDHTPTECIATLESILVSVRPPEVSYRPAYVIPGWRWVGPSEQTPHTAIAFNDLGDPNREFYLAAFWPTSNGSDCGLFPLGSGDERLASLPIIGRWKQRDPSLISTGVVPRGQITLTSPRVPEQYFTELLSAAGFRATPRNLQLLGVKVGEMFRAKAGQFIADKDPRAAQNFVYGHQYNGGPVQAFCQGILDDLATQEPSLLPYFQDLPGVVRGILLEGVHDRGTIWQDFER